MMLSSPLSTAKKMLIIQEGLRLMPYRCSTGKLTIGVGRNLDDNGISEAEALHLLSNDILNTWRELSDTFPWFNHLDDIRQLALVSMAFNMGVPTLATFKRMISAFIQKDYKVAALQASDSKWAVQVGKRDDLIVQMIRTGVLPDEFK